MNPFFYATKYGFRGFAGKDSDKIKDVASTVKDSDKIDRYETVFYIKDHEKHPQKSGLNRTTRRITAEKSTLEERTKILRTEDRKEK